MDLNAATLWWVAAGVLIATELATGTFYLLMLALGTAAAALASYAGLGFTAQLVTAAIVGGGAVILWHSKRSREPKPAPAASNPDVNLDIGSRVHVAHWHADGTARVQYRGADWNVRFQGTGTPTGGDYLISALEGSTLLLKK